MPISSIQYRLATGNYQRQSKLLRNTDRKISKQYLECIQPFEQIAVLKNSSTKIDLKKYSRITVNKQNKIKTTFLLLILINQVMGDKNTLLNNPNNFPNLSNDPINNPHSFRDITKKIPQNFPVSFTNSSTSHESNFISMPALLSNKQTINYTNDIGSNPFSSKMINYVNKKLSHFLEKKGFLDRSKKNIRKEEFICSVFSYFYRGNKESWEIATKILSVFYTNKKERHAFLTIEYKKKILSDWFFKNIIEESPVEYLANIIANDKSSFSYTINDMMHILSIETLSRNRKIDLNLLSPTIRIFFKKLWFENLKLKMPFFYFWYKDKTIGTISLQDLEFSNLYTGAQFLYDFNMLDKFDYKEASKIGKKIWGIAVRKGITSGIEDYFWAPSIIFEADYAPQKFNKEKNKSKETIITEQLRYRKTIQQLSKSVKNNLNNYRTSLKKWSDKKNILNRDEINRITVKVVNSFSALDKDLILLALTSIRSYETSFIFSLDAIIRPISFDIQTVTRKQQPIITPIVGQRCFNFNYKTVSCLKNPNTLKPTPNINIFLNKTDLFSVQVENEERIYALKDDTNKYQLFRIDRDITKYINTGILNYKNLHVRYFISNNKIITREKELSLKFINEEPLIKGNITKFINFLVNKHSSNLFNLSFQATRESSNLKTGWWDVLKHFIPFYDYVSDSLNVDFENALPSCLIDAAIFTPVGASEFLEEKFSLNLGKALYKNSISLEGSKLTKNLPIINEVSINSNNLDLVIKESVGKKFTNELINTLSEDEKTISLSQKLKTVLSKKSLSFFPDSHITAYLPDSKITVSVIKAAEKEGKNIYVIVDPKTANSGWVRYTMEENKQLVPLKPFPNIKITKQLRKFITPKMYATNINIKELSLPDYYTGLRWDRNHKNAYLSFNKNFLNIKILDTQPFLVLKNQLVPLNYKNNKLGLENLLHRLARLQKVGLSGRNLLPKQVIANKLRISEEEALTLLNKYEFTGSSYYTDKTFALWIKETGEIPEWSEAFKILNLEDLPERFMGSHLQDNNLYRFSHAEGFAYRADSTPPERILSQGFTPSHDYMALQKMLKDTDIGLIVSGDITGALRYNTIAKSPYIYKIALENIRGVSLKDNLVRNENGLKLFLEEDPNEHYKTIDSVAEITNGAIYLDEIHLYYPDIKITAISLVSDEEIQQAEPLSEGPWKNYL